MVISWPAVLRTPPHLGVGPVSRNCVSAVISVAYQNDTSIMVIPSRGQVDAEELGGGYVEDWSPERFSSYVRLQDPDYRIMLCRDHGGPWQGATEQRADLGEADACLLSLTSFQADIDAGFDLLHIDTSKEGTGGASYDAALRRLGDLYGRCVEMAHRRNRSVRFEIGVEAQGADADEPGRFRSQVTDMIDQLRATELPGPFFVVAQTGTKVLETRNVGALTDEKQTARVLRDVAILADICHEQRTFLKAHNCDYLPPRLVRELLRAGVDSVNVAPELGVTETRSLIRIMDELGLSSLRDQFLAISYESGKWAKWLAPDSTTSDYERAIIAGHYVFSRPDARELMARVDQELRRRSRPSLTSELLSEIIQVIERYHFMMSVAADLPPAIMRGYT